MNKPVYLGLSTLNLSKTVIYEFWNDYVKPKCGVNAKTCYAAKDSFIVHVKTDDIYKDIAEDFETIFDTSNFELVRPLPKRKIRKWILDNWIIGLMEDKLGGRIMTKFVRSKAKFYSYLIDDDNEDKKTKGAKKVCHKKKT